MTIKPWIISVPHTGSYSLSHLFGGFSNVLFKHFYEVTDVAASPKVYTPLRDPFEALASARARCNTLEEFQTSFDKQLISWRRLLAWSSNPKFSFIRTADLPVRENVSNHHDMKSVYQESQFKIARSHCVPHWDALDELRCELHPFLTAHGVFVGAWAVDRPLDS